MSATANAALAAKPSLTLTRRLKASPARVYAAWTDPQKMMRWWAPYGGTTLRAETELRVGGRYHVGFIANGEEHNVSGVYREIVPDRKLVFTWAWRSTPERESLVTLIFAPDGDGTLFTITHEQFFDEAARDRHNRGWNSVLESLEHYLA